MKIGVIQATSQRDKNKLLYRCTAMDLFGRINDGNAVSLPLGLNFGWAGEINLQCTIEKLFADAFGIGYPPEDAERKREVLKRCLKSVIEGWERCAMKLKNILIVVKDIEKSRQFYHDLFGLDQVFDNDGNLILTEGLVLQDEKIWKKFLGREILPENNACELYFEEREIEAFAEKLEKLYPSIRYVNRLMTHSWGQKVIRFYDLDGNLIEVGTPR